MTLSARQLAVLRWMRDHDDADPSELEDGELVYERGVAYIGYTRVSARTFLALLRAMAISAAQDSQVGRFERYRINETGRRILAAAEADGK